MTEHFCDERLLPGECIVCIDKPRPFVIVESWAGSERVEVEILGRTHQRTRIRFLHDNSKGRCGDVRTVTSAVVRGGKDETCR